MSDFGYSCSKCGQPLIPSTSGKYSMCSDLMCGSKLVDTKLPAPAAKRNLAITNCDARDANYNPYTQSWDIPPDQRSWELVQSINRQLRSWPAGVPRDEANCIALKDGTVPCWFRLESK